VDTPHTALLPVLVPPLVLLGPVRSLEDHPQLHLADTQDEVPGCPSLQPHSPCPCLPSLLVSHLAHPPIKVV
jgi:hypothetical protein